MENEKKVQSANETETQDKEMTYEELEAYTHEFEKQRNRKIRKSKVLGGLLLRRVVE